MVENRNTGLAIGDRIKGIKERFGLKLEPVREGSRSKLWSEQYVSPTGMAGAVGHFGERIHRRTMDKKIQQILDTHPEQSVAEGWYGPVGKEVGFSAIFRTPEGDTIETVNSEALEVAVKLARSVLEQRGWNPEEVEIVDFANSAGWIGMSDALKAKLVQELKMKPTVEVFGTSMACDSAGNALYRRLVDKDSQNKKVLLISVDPVTGDMPLDVDQADTLSMQFFSNGAAALAYQPGVDMELMTGKTEEHEDVDGVLGAVPQYAAYIDAIDEKERVNPTGRKPSILYRIGRELVAKLPKPIKGKFFMNGFNTSRFFLKYAGANIRAVYDQYKQLFPEREVDHATMHHPNLAIFDRIRRHFPNLPFKWVVPEGNSSGATSLIAFVRSMSNFKPGDHVFYTSFGVGGSFTSFVIRIGEEEKQGLPIAA
jgi:3-oxoacyl-[acyl-carrier-protein] synthase III